ncbi:LysE family translocator [Streptomyces sp. 900105755]|uniref:LysE family translocator n=1 Tax=Streptomyces sp. Ag109_O5-10 TaxID=1855349 RepID=UPI000898D1CF|nr:LysE family translocator [Streptomyces sp. Ag109_O5-10]SEE97523.1 Threonine/homoserine/homoserine lactone efflux protein [Streptomyces sp. Ag109_O5-10]
MDTGLLLSFLAVDLLLVCVPGADWAYVISAGVRGRSVPRAVAGLIAGYALHTALAVAGLAVLVARSPRLLTALTVAGAGYLLWLGWGVLRRPTVPREAEGAGGAGAGPQGFRRGAAISGLNPKALLLYLSVLPQFLVTTGAHLPVAAQTAVLGALHMAACAAVYLAVGALSRALLAARPRAARAVTRTSGAAMLGIGALLLGERLF